MSASDQEYAETIPIESGATEGDCEGDRDDEAPVFSSTTQKRDDFIDNEAELSDNSSHDPDEKLDDISVDSNGNARGCVDQKVRKKKWELKKKGEKRKELSPSLTASLSKEKSKSKVGSDDDEREESSADEREHAGAWTAIPPHRESRGFHGPGL
jgi:hypothetical protein